MVFNALCQRELPLSAVPYQPGEGINTGRQLENKWKKGKRQKDVHQQNAIPPIQLDEEPSAED